MFFYAVKKWGVLPTMSISEADIGHDRRVAAVGTGGRGGALVADKLRAASRFPRFLLQQCQRSLAVGRSAPHTAAGLSCTLSFIKQKMWGPNVVFII